MRQLLYRHRSPMADPVGETSSSPKTRRSKHSFLIFMCVSRLGSNHERVRSCSNLKIFRIKPQEERGWRGSCLYSRLIRTLETRPHRVPPAASRLGRSQSSVPSFKQSERSLPDLIGDRVHSLPQGLGNASAAIYCFAPPSPPVRQDLQIPKPLPFAWMKPQNDVRCRPSAWVSRLSPAGKKELSVSEYVVGVAGESVQGCAPCPHSSDNSSMKIRRIATVVDHRRGDQLDHYRRWCRWAESVADRVALNRQ